MTNTAPAPTDIRREFALAVSVSVRVIAGVRPDQLADPTPCADFDVRGLMNHLVMVLRRVAAMGRGESPFSVTDQVDDGRWTDEWLTAAHQCQDAWTDERLTASIELPWTTMSGHDALAVYVSEVIVHTWDLAQATLQEADWPHPVLEAAYAALVPQMPATGRSDEIPFADAVTVADDAPILDRLIAYSGRQP
ncbi:MAG TPA: TIGR03086 family metal-binding protein [Acidimicrobiales bacterium]|jgi:uncharacterized protein (TIGR03086 family)|nr:TIGR03086 family metal-binding protein [Acidimicrobiales bacterium]